MSKRQEMQRLIRQYKDETGKTEIEMHEVARWAASKGWPLPIPANPLDVLAKEFANAAREQVDYNPTTGNPYRRYHALKVNQGGTQLHLFIDIEDATRRQMHASLVNRREQMVSDGLQLTFDQEHWNSLHQSEEPIQLPMDLAFDIELRKNAPKPEDEAEAA